MKRLYALILAFTLLMAGIPAQAGLYSAAAVLAAPPALTAANEDTLNLGANTVTIPKDTWEMSFTLTFANDNVDRMRYEITASDPTIEIGFTNDRGGAIRRGAVRFNDKPGSVHTITVYRTSENQSSVTLTVRKLEIVSIQQVNVPDLVAGPSEFEINALDELQFVIQYADHSTETIRTDDFDNREIVNGLFYEKNENGTLQNQIDSINGYKGAYSYAKLRFGEADSWTSIVKFHMVPYNVSNYPLMKPDNTKFRLTSPKRTMLRIQITSPGLYEFVGDHAEGGVAIGYKDGESWGSYTNGKMGFNHGYLNPGTYFVSAKVREDENGNIPSEGFIWCHKQAILKSVDIEVTDPQKITWENWGTSIKKVYRYQDPQTGALKEFKQDAGDENVFPNDNGYYFESVLRLDPAEGKDQWKLALEQDYGDQYQRLLGYSCRCEKTVTIRNIMIEDGVEASVGEDTSSQIDESINAIIEGGGSVVTDVTPQQIEEVKKNDENAHFSANLEIRQGDDAQDKKLAENDAGADAEMVMFLDADIVVRGKAKELGNIEETSGEIELAVTVTDYDPDGEYWIERVHKGACQKLTPKRITKKGKGAVIWFGTNKFSSFAVIKGSASGSKKKSNAAAPPKKEKITISKAPASVKTKVKKNKATVSWKKIKKTKKTKKLLGQIKSIQVQYATDKKFTKNVVTKKLGKNKTKIVLTLKKKKKYYIRVRYVGKKGVSKWTKTKTVKVR